MLQTWRWFGPDDPVSVADMLQSGVQGVVSALHHVPPGQVWTTSEIDARQNEISRLPSGEASGLKWDVVESLPVSEEIKTQSGDASAHIRAYCESLTNLATAGLRTVCYNFMPVLDWTRTDLAASMPHGGHAMKFDLEAFAAFDLCILKRADAKQDYDPEVTEAARTLFCDLNDGQRKSLEKTIVSGLPGANDSWTLEDVKDRLATYDRIDAARLRSHLVDFLSEVIPQAERLGINLCAHPDDPPFDLMGLPRVLSSEADYVSLCAAVDVVNNGVTLCTGSLGVAPDFDPVSFVNTLGPRIHFAHLRNTLRVSPASGARTSFVESAHLEGDTNMAAVVAALLAEEERRKLAGRSDDQIPFRPDHGQALLSDLNAETLPGYPLIGRMRGLAELRGIVSGLSHRRQASGATI